MPIRQATSSLTFGLVGLAALAVATLPARADGACFVSPARLADDAIASFLTAPGDLLATYASGGLPLANHVRSLVGSSDKTLDPVLALVAAASDSQRSAIGAGLARVAKACAKASPEYVALIQEKVAALGDAGVTVAFVSALGDVQTTAIGEVGAGAALSGASDIGGARSGGIDGGSGSSGNTQTGDTSFDNDGETVTFSSGSRNTSVSPGS